MRFERVTAPDHPLFEGAFQLYERSFPTHERRTRDRQERVLSHPDYRYEVITRDGAPAGILLSWEAGDFLYVEHFAVAPELRGGGVGSLALARLIGRGKDVVLEIDPPVDETARRRQHFYEKAGFFANPFPHVHPPYRPGFSGHGLVVMTAPAPWEGKKYEQFLSFLQHTVMEDCKDACSR